MNALVQDLRHSLRILRQSPAFTIAAVAALTLGIGANTAIFSVVNTVLLKPLPYPDPDRLLVFTNTSPQGSGPGASPTKFEIWRKQTAAFQDVSAYRFNVVNVTGGSDPEQIASGMVSADFFRLFGVRVISGRTFTPDEDRPNGGHVVVLSEGFWKRRFGSDLTLVGRTVSRAGDPYVVIGHRSGNAAGAGRRRDRGGLGIRPHPDPRELSLRRHSARSDGLCLRPADSNRHRPCRRVASRPSGGARRSGGGVAI